LCDVAGLERTDFSTATREVLVNPTSPNVPASIAKGSR